jgi:iron complex outermembrane recepter protein
MAGGASAYVSVSDQRHHRWMDTGSQGYSDRFHVDTKARLFLGNVTVTPRFSYDDSYENNYNGVTLAEFAANPEWDNLTGNWTGQPLIDQNYILGWATVRENWLGAVRFEADAAPALKLHVHPYWHHQKGRGDWLPPYQRLGYTANGARVDAAPLAAVQARAFFQDAAGNPIPVGDPATAPAGVTFYDASNPYDLGTYPEAVRAGAKPISSFRTSEYEFDRYGTTFGATWEIDERNTLKFGGWYEQLRRDWGRDWHRVVDATVGYEWDRRPYWTDFASELETDTLMLYVQDTVRLGDLTVSLGVKQFYVDLGYRDVYGVNPSKSFDSDSDILPSIGFVYSLDGAGQLFGGYTENFSAVLDEVITRDLSRSLEPETADSFDFGYRITRGPFSASAAVYYADFNNRITFVTPRTVNGVTEINYDIGQGGGYVNVGGIESRGAEIAVSVDVTENVGAYVTATWNESEYTRTIPENGVVAGHRVVGSPEWLFAATGFYQAGPMRASLSGKYTGSRYGTLDNREELGGTTTWDASLGYQMAQGVGPFRGVSAALYVTNLLDKSYLAGLDGGGSATAGSGYYFIGAPRTVSAALTLEF